jgi:uncharacterized OB-fold protein
MTSEAAPAGATRMAPIVTPDTKFFWEAADRGQFVGQKCGECGKYTFPPRPMCPRCHSLQREVVPLSGRGAILSWTVPRHPPAFGFKEAPIVVVVRLEEGVNFVSNLVGARLEQVSAGMQVEVLFEPTAGDHQVPVFRPVAG